MGAEKISFPIPEMRRIRKIHMIGVGGAGMSGIAEVLRNLGYEVSGSDIRESATTRRLRELGISVLIGHQPEHVCRVHQGFSKRPWSPWHWAC